MNSIVSMDPGAIHIRAYARWQERGCPQGSAEHDWFEAERDLERELQRMAAGNMPAARSAAITPVALSTPVAPKPASAKKEPKAARAARATPARRATKRTQATVVSKPGDSALAPQGRDEKPAPATVTGKRRAANGSM